MKIYSTQILMATGFLGELIITGFTWWALGFFIMLMICNVFNFIMELKEK